MLTPRVTPTTARACNICGRRTTLGPRCERCALRPRPRGRAWEATRLRIFQRDGWHCQVQLSCCTGAATQIDHIVQLAKGGSDEDSNLRAACSPCNLARGDR